LNTIQHLPTTLPSISSDTPLWHDVQQATVNPTNPFGDLSVASQAQSEGEGHFAAPQAEMATTLPSFNETFGPVNIPSDYPSVSVNFLA
jgi:hypothetical protein